MNGFWVGGFGSRPPDLSAVDRRHRVNLVNVHHPVYGVFPHQWPQRYSYVSYSLTPVSAWHQLLSIWGFPKFGLPFHTMRNTGPPSNGDCHKSLRLSPKP